MYSSTLCDRELLLEAPFCKDSVILDAEERSVKKSSSSSSRTIKLYSTGLILTTSDKAAIIFTVEMDRLVKIVYNCPGLILNVSIARSAGTVVYEKGNLDTLVQESFRTSCYVCCSLLLVIKHSKKYFKIVFCLYRRRLLTQRKIGKFHIFARKIKEKLPQA